MVNKKTGVIVLAAVALALVFLTVLAAVGVWIGVTWIARQADTGPAGDLIARPWGLDSGQEVGPGRWGYGGPGMMWNSEGRFPRRGPGGPSMGTNPEWRDMPCVEGYGGPGMCGGPGMMGRNWNWDKMPCNEGYTLPEGESTLSLKDAASAVERYVKELGYEGLHLTEVMEFEYNFYAIVAEEDTGIGAMELLVDKASGAVGPERGPNMMWNAEYGMHGWGRGAFGMGRMMGGYATGEMTLSPEEAGQEAQRWLDANLPGREAGEADAFYGYYTLHFLQDGQIEGMLSVHGSTGDVWYHSWHGDFVAMMEGHD